MKITLFFCAGNYAETLGVHKVSEMNGVGRRMPLTTVAFSIGALGMIGVPFTAGYVSKHYLTDGADAAGAAWAGWVLVASGILNAAYFLPILFRAWLRRPAGPWPDEHIRRRGWPETNLLLLAPPVFSAATVIVVALFADSNWSPLAWAKLIAAREYLRWNE